MGRSSAPTRRGRAQGHRLTGHARRLGQLECGLVPAQQAQRRGGCALTPLAGGVMDGARRRVAAARDRQVIEAHVQWPLTNSGLWPAGSSPSSMSRSATPRQGLSIVCVTTPGLSVRPPATPWATGLGTKPSLAMASSTALLLPLAHDRDAIEDARHRAAGHTGRLRDQLQGQGSSAELAAAGEAAAPRRGIRGWRLAASRSEGACNPGFSPPAMALVQCARISYPKYESGFKRSFTRV